MKEEAMITFSKLCWLHLADDRLLDRACWTNGWPTCTFFCQIVSFNEIILLNSNRFQLYIIPPPLLQIVTMVPKWSVCILSIPITNNKIERTSLWSACISIVNKTTNSWPSTTMAPRWSAWQCQTPRLSPCICSYALCHQAFLLVSMSSSLYLYFCREVIWTKSECTAAFFRKNVPYSKEYSLTQDIPGHVWWYWGQLGLDKPGDKPLDERLQDPDQPSGHRVRDLIGQNNLEY